LKNVKDLREGFLYYALTVNEKLTVDEQLKVKNHCEQERKCIHCRALSNKRVIHITMKMSHPPYTNILELSQILSLHLSKTMALEEEDGRTQDKSYYVTDDYLNRFHHWTVATSKLRKDELRT
jgi:hypothetical protein